MKSWAKICLIVGMSCTLAGAVLCGAGYIGHGLDYVKAADLNTLNGSARKDTGSLAVLKKTKIDSFRKLDISLDSLGLKILPSKDDNCYISYITTNSSASKPVNWEVKDSTLTLSENTGNTSNHYVHVDIGFLLELLQQDSNHTPDDDTVCLYLPEKMLLSDTTIKSSFGDVLLSGLSTQKATVSLSDGELEVQNCKFKSSTFTSDFGDIDMTSSDLTDCTITLSDGDIDCEDLIFNRKNSISNEFGDISVDGKRQQLSAITLTADTDLGDIELSDNLESEFQKQSDEDTKYVAHTSKKNNTELTLHTDDGDIELE